MRVCVTFSGSANTRVLHGHFPTVYTSRVFTKINRPIKVNCLRLEHNNVNGNFLQNKKFIAKEKKGREYVARGKKTNNTLEREHRYLYSSSWIIVRVGSNIPTKRVLLPLGVMHRV